MQISPNRSTRFALLSLLMVVAAGCGSQPSAQAGPAKTDSLCRTTTSTTGRTGQDLVITGPTGTEHIHSSCVPSDPANACGARPGGHFFWSLFSPDATPAAYSLSLSIAVTPYTGAADYPLPGHAFVTLSLIRSPGAATSDVMSWDASAGTVSVKADEVSGTVNAVLSANTTPDPANHVVASTGQYRVYGAFQCKGGKIAYVGPTAAPVTVADVQAKLLTGADLPGSSSETPSDLAPCFTYQRPVTSAPRAQSEWGQPVGSASEDVTEFVDVFSSAADARAYAAMLEAAVRACPPKASHVAVGRTITETLTTGPATLGAWNGTRTIAFTTVAPATRLSKVVDYVYMMSNGVLAVELDVSIDNVDPSPAYQAQADTLVQLLTGRLLAG